MQEVGRLVRLDRTAVEMESHFYEIRKRSIKAIHAPEECAYRFLPTAPPWRQLRFRDCAEIYKAGYNTSGVYRIYVDSNATEPTKVGSFLDTSTANFCNFDSCAECICCDFLKMPASYIL